SVVGLDAFDCLVTDSGLAARVRDAYGERLVCVPIPANARPKEEFSA
ncbi:MAG: hypothetical protein JWM85_3256, partial [Acidimicrobiaceae bacterium]|nr:hypothetical protein [Acidimicrobiaceae bacterium]